MQLSYFSETDINAEWTVPRVYNAKQQKGTEIQFEIFKKKKKTETYRQNFISF